MKYITLIFLLGLLLATQTGCSLPGFPQGDDQTGQPSVAISQPAANQQAQLGQILTVQSVSVGTGGIARTELIVDDQVVWIDANANPEPNVPFIVAQPWLPQHEGEHTLQVRAISENDVAGLSEPIVVQVVTTVVDTTPTAQSSGGNIIVLSDQTATPQRSTPTQTAVAATPTVAVTPQATTVEPSSEATATRSNTTPTPTPAPQNFNPTGLEPTGIFKKIWSGLGGGNSRLGYPIAPMISDRDFARQRFEFGLMYWWDNPETPDYIWVIDSPAEDLNSGSTSNLYPDTWQATANEISCEAAVDGGPVRGFGKVWCEHPELLERIGYPAEPELGSGGSAPFAQVQFFQGGAMFSSPIDKEVFVLYEQGDWLRFGE